MLLALALGCRTVMPVANVPTGPASADAWERTLAAVVDEHGRVDYDLLASRRDALDAWLAFVAQERPHVDRENGQHHVWLNAYNALVLRGVLDLGVRDSVLDVDGWIPVQGSGLFVETAWIVQGSEVSLSEIRHERLRGKVMDHRDVAALVDGAMHDPPLRPELYRQNRLDEQLKDQLAVWLDDEERGMRVEADRVWFSPLVERYAFDLTTFTGGEDLCMIASRAVGGEKGERLRELAERGCPRSSLPWDWRLNRAGAAPR